jgi:hypothetical protein
MIFTTKWKKKKCIKELELRFRTSGSLFNIIALKRSALIRGDLGPDSALAVVSPPKKNNIFLCEIVAIIKKKLNYDT